MFDVKSRRGVSKIGVLIFLAALFFGGYTAWKFIDAKIQIASFEDKCKTTAKFASMKKSKKDIVEEVLFSAREIWGPQPPVTKEMITVSDEGRKWRIVVNYVLNIKTPLFTQKKNVVVDVESPQF